MSEKEKNGLRQYVGITFNCCNVYTRIYINKKRDAFVGWCPKCAKNVTIKISPDGEDSQFFEVG